jgi:hypothetical protein
MKCSLSSLQGKKQNKNSSVGTVTKYNDKIIKTGK